MKELVVMSERVGGHERERERERELVVMSVRVGGHE